MTNSNGRSKPSNPSAAKDLDVFANRLMTAAGYEGRWRATQTALGALGADAINAAEGNTLLDVPFWFRSTLPKVILDQYAADDHWKNDFILHQALRNDCGVVWSPDSAPVRLATAGAWTFDEFVRDCGTTAIVTFSMSVGTLGDSRALSLIANEATSEVLHAENLARIEQVIRLALPWINPSDTMRGEEFVRYPARNLTVREREALRLLAGGFLTARIAETMGLAEVTVHKHLRNARHKLGARTREQAVVEAIRRREIGL